MRIVVIGDVHGCAEELKELVELVEYKQGFDRVIMVGDLIDRGPSPRETVQYVMKMGFEMCKSNHEVKMVDFIKYHKGRQPHPDRLVEWMSFSDEEINWLDDLPLWIEFDGYLVCHGGLEPKPLSEQIADRVIRCRWVDEKTGVYKGLQHIEVPSDAVTSNSSPDAPLFVPEKKPRPESSHAQTPEAIALRQKRAADRLARGEAATPAQPTERVRKAPKRYRTSLAQPPGTVDWQKMWPGPQSVIYGHAAQRSGEVRIDEHSDYACFGLDTGCVFGGSLSAMVIDDSLDCGYKFVSVKAKKVYYDWPAEGGE